jgi:hypothetical protein
MNSREVDDSLDRWITVPYKIESISTLEALHASEVDWNRLSETAEHRNALMTYGRFMTSSRRRAAEHRTGRSEPHVLILKEAE